MGYLEYIILLVNGIGMMRLDAIGIEKINAHGCESFVRQQIQCDILSREQNRLVSFFNFFALKS